MIGTVYFIGAGPGDPELITVKGQRLIAQADLVVYAGSLVPEQVVAGARPGVEKINSAPLTLEQTHECIARTALAGGMVARVHTGDPSLYGAVAEQARLLDRDGIPWAVVPGVTSACAAAAAARVSFTSPGGTQSLTITRVGGRTPVPAAQTLENFARTGTSLAIYLSAALADNVQERLLMGGYAASTPVVVAHQVGWPGEIILRTSLEGLAKAAKGLKTQVVFLILPDLDKYEDRSQLYDPSYSHGWRAPG